MKSCERSTKVSPKPCSTPMATTEPPPSTVPAELEALFQRHGEELVEELTQLAEMPQVRLTEKSVYDRASPPGSKAQLRGVQFKLRCCTGPPLVKKCNDLEGERACPTVLEAVRTRPRPDLGPTSVDLGR